jgi:hypothetical protein
MFPLCAAAEAEQLEIEMWFRKTRSLRSMYWLGLEKSGYLYYWQDGTKVNNGNVSNEDPCEHELQPLHLETLCHLGVVLLDVVQQMD